MYNQKLPEPNTVVKAIAELLLSDKESVEFRDDYLEKDQLDYSIESLKYIDSYLEKVRKNKKFIKNELYSKIILRCGAYSGEVIRKNSKKDFSWTTYDEAVKNHKIIKDYGKSLLTQYILESKKNNIIIFPMAKVEKYLSNGKAESLFFYGETILK